MKTGDFQRKHRGENERNRRVERRKWRDGCIFSLFSSSSSPEKGIFLMISSESCINGRLNMFRNRHKRLPKNKCGPPEEEKINVRSHMSLKIFFQYFFQK